MNFFTGINTQQNTFELGGSVGLIPKNTRVVASCEEAKTDSYNSETHINLKWRVNLPKEFANRVVFQKLRVYDQDQAKQKTAREMLAAIATNAGGRLFQAMAASNEQMPSDATLQTLCSSPMVLQLDVWEINGKSGNWVRLVAPYFQQAPAQVQQPAPAQVQQQAPAQVQQQAPAQVQQPAPAQVQQPAPAQVQQPAPAVALVAQVAPSDYSIPF